MLSLMLLGIFIVSFIVSYCVVGWIIDTIIMFVKTTKTYEMKHLFLDDNIIFTEETAPKWLRGDGKGDTMDNRWFWDEHVSTLKVGETVLTDFHMIKRIK